MNILLIFIGKLILWVSRNLNLGHGSTWPGHIALSLNPNFIKDLLQSYSSSERRESRSTNLKIILIAGTNGKTTTSKMMQIILERDGKKVFQNEAGANLLNGIASSLLLHSSILSTLPYDYAVFEVDENSLPLVLNELTPDYLILLNLFRDQLDRYGEVNTIANKWSKAIKQLSNKTTLILNADDPQIAHLGISLLSLRAQAKQSHPQVLYFGLHDISLSQKQPQHAADSTYCPNCNHKLFYNTVYFSHLGNWKCTNCSLARPGLTGMSPFYPLSGVYNRYNTLAAVLLCRTIGINQKTIDTALEEFKPAFGRQEIIEIDGKKIQLFLSKNPTSFNESLRTVKELGARNILFVLNDRIPDGRDVSWIWDVDFEQYVNENMNIVVSGDRCYDMGLRIKYTEPLISNITYIIQENLNEAIKAALKKTSKSETLYILPTYSAMLEVRKILTGRKIL